MAKAAEHKLLRTDKVRADTTVVEAAVAYLHRLGFVGQGGGGDDAHNQAYSGRWRRYPHPGA